MTWFPNISDYSPQKVGNVVKQDKTKRQHGNLADEEQRREHEADEKVEKDKKKNDGLLDVYV